MAGPKEMVKLLRLCVDYGEDKVLEAIARVKVPELSVEQIRAYLMPVHKPLNIYPKIDVPVTKPQIEKYDALMYRGAAL